MQLLRVTSVPAAARPDLVLRASVLLVATVLALTGCSPADRSGSARAATDGPSPTGSLSVSHSAQRDDVTAPGSTLAFGDTATVDFGSGRHGMVLDLTVRSATQGSIEDFKGFDLSDPYKRKGSYYYVRVSVKNAGKQKVGGGPVPLWGMSGRGTLLRPVSFTSAFGTCPTEGLPKDFAPRDKLDTCLVYLSPNHGDLEGVSYRPTADYQPIEWHGKVERPSTKSTGKGTKQ